MQEKIKEGINKFNSERADDDINLIEIVRSMVIASGQGALIVQAYDKHHFISEAVNKPSEVQRYLLNRYWSAQLLLANNNSTEERYCLIPNGTIGEWIKLFEQKIIPFIVKNDLPKIIIN